MLSMMSNDAQHKRWLCFATLSSILLPAVVAAERTHAKGPAKREAVIRDCMEFVQDLITRGFLPWEAAVDLKKPAGELVDLAAARFFPPSKNGKNNSSVDGDSVADLRGTADGGLVTAGGGKHKGKG